MMAALSAAALLVMASAPTSGSLPAVDRLFSCPLNPAQEHFTPPTHWASVVDERSRIAVSVPPTWTIDRRPHRLEIVAPDRSFRVSVRHNFSQTPEGLEHARRSLEVSELGAPFVTPTCADRVARSLKNEAPWLRAQFGYYGRPLGERRRRVALYASAPSGTVAVIVSTRWPRGKTGPDWARVWGLLGSVRPEASKTSQELAHWGGDGERLHGPPASSAGTMRR